jgi:hypothetical protein
MGSGLPQFGFPRRFAIDLVSFKRLVCACFPGNGLGEHLSHAGTLQLSILRIFSSKINKKMNRFRTKVRSAHFRLDSPILLSWKGLAALMALPVHRLGHCRLFKTRHSHLSGGTILV